jgi:NADH-quinone oxidoreductase subunit G
VSETRTTPSVTVTINGQTVQAEKGRLLIDVAEEMGIFVPRFCYHPGMKSVAVCRMCLVKIEGQRKLQPACATPVADGMEVSTVDPEAAGAQKSILEFLLINHPLDCPICDRAGECPLQDQTYAHGPGTSRYIEPKRTYEKALEISDLVVLDRERCVLCWRCVRFADEIAGDQFIQLVDRGDGTQILTFNDEPFDSYFSGNTVQICPVGALTAKPYRFVSRPWDLNTGPSVCAYCSVGCPISNEERSGKLVRCQALPNENVNDFWICDKGRFGFHYVDSRERLTNPLIRTESDEFSSASWGEALSVVAERLRSADRVGVIAGGHLTTEDAYAIARLSREVLETNNVDSRIQDAGAPYELALEAGPAAGSTAVIDDIDTARTVVWVGPDPKEALPVLYLRLRVAVLDKGVKLVVVSPRRTSLDAFATHVIRCEAGGEAKAVRSLMSGAQDPAPVARDLGAPFVVCWGPASPGRDEAATFQAVIDLVADAGGKLLVCPPHAGSQGMIDMGVHPSLAPGYTRVEEPGLDTRGILEAAAAGELDALLVFGADLVGDFPDSDLALRALSGSAFTVVTELFPTETAARADVVFPSAAYAEREGTFTNLERRLQKLEALLVPGTAREVWRTCSAIASALGTEWGWEDMSAVWEDITRDVKTHAEVDLAVLTQRTPNPSPQMESGFELRRTPMTVAGPGGHYPKGHRSGAPFQTGQNWPLSWELRAFEARQRPGLVPSLDGGGPGGGDAEAQARAAAGDGIAAGEPTRREPGRFILYTGRMIYDEGSMISRSTALRGMTKRPFVELSPKDAGELGVGQGSEVTLSSDAGEARLTVRIADIAPGSVFVPYDQPGFKAASLIRGVNPVVEVKPG